MSTTPTGGFGSEWRLQEPRRIVIFPIVAVACIAVLAAATAYLYVQVLSLRKDIDSRLQLQETQIAKMDTSVNSASKAVETKVRELRKVVDTAQTQIEQAATQVEKQASSKAQKVAQDLTQDLAKKLEAKHDAAITVVGDEVRELKKVASQTDTRIGSLSGEVSEVKKAVSQTRTELDSTIASLKSVRGDLGAQSGLIATNAKELQALRELGERSYYEFNLTKAAQLQQVGDVRITLKKADVKRNRYTIELLVDDRKIEKKDKTVNEPVQFFVAGQRTPHELVVNQVQKDRLLGYLSTPKVVARR